MDEFWNRWQPRERATLCFIIQNGEILLIRKKRGLGAGKINAPGGRIEPGESPIDCAIRETREEVGVIPHGVEEKGILHFEFKDGYSLHCTVFTATGFSGELIETDEALPIWSAIECIPYDEMWADDAHWLPGVISGGAFRGYFHFDGELMLTKNVIWDIQPRRSALEPI